jgi:hypothetical protein
MYKLPEIGVIENQSLEYHLIGQHYFASDTKPKPQWTYATVCLGVRRIASVWIE